MCAATKGLGSFWGTDWFGWITCVPVVPVPGAFFGMAPNMGQQFGDNVDYNSPLQHTESVFFPLAFLAV